MKKLIIFILILLISIWIGLQIQRHPGYVLITLPNFTLQTPLWFAILSLLIVLVILYVLFRLLQRIFGLPRYFRRRAKIRRLLKSQKLTDRGLLKLGEKNWRHAERLLIQGSKYKKSPLINYLAAAVAAHEQQAFDHAENYLKQAYAIQPKEAVVTGLTQSRLALSAKKNEQALAILLRLKRLFPKHPEVLRLLSKTYLELNDWKSLRKLLPQLIKYRLLEEGEKITLEGIVFSNLLNKEVAEQNDFKQLEAFWHNLPKAAQQNALVLQTYARYLMKYKQDQLAEKLLREGLKRHWDSGLVEIYGQINANSMQQLQVAESWLKLHPQDPYLFFCLARICISNRLWGKAKDYLKKVLAMKQTPLAYFSLATIYENIGNQQAALENFHLGSKLITNNVSRETPQR